jgi:hypothetical protein
VPSLISQPPQQLTFRRTADIIVQQKYQHPESLAIRSATLSGPHDSHRYRGSTP